MQKFCDLLLVARLLVAELVAGKSQHLETPLAEALVQLLEPGVLRGEAAFARDIDDQQRLAVEGAKRLGLAVDGFQRDVGGEGHGGLQAEVRRF